MRVVVTGIISNSSHLLLFHIEGHQASWLVSDRWLSNPRNIFSDCGLVTPFVKAEVNGQGLLFLKGYTLINFPLLDLYRIYSLLPKKIPSVDLRFESSSCTGISWGVDSELYTETSLCSATMGLNKCDIITFLLKANVWWAYWVWNFCWESRHGVSGSSTSPCRPEWHWGTAVMGAVPLLSRGLWMSPQRLLLHARQGC